MVEKENDSHSQCDGVIHQMRTGGDQHFMEGMYILVIGGQFDDDVVGARSSFA